MASEESPASEGNTNNQTASENIYDIFGTSLETTEIDEKDSWVEICHRCLRLFFSFFLFLFVLGTALISRLTFHIILINLNPPTIFTTMNKFGGDTGNTTAPFFASPSTHILDLGMLPRISSTIRALIGVSYWPILQKKRLEEGRHRRKQTKDWLSYSLFKCS